MDLWFFAPLRAVEKSARLSPPVVSREVAVTCPIAEAPRPGRITLGCWVTARGEKPEPPDVRRWGTGNLGTGEARSVAMPLCWKVR